MDGTTLRANLVSLDSAIADVLATPGPNYSVSGPQGSQTVEKSGYLNQLLKSREDTWRLLISIEPYIVNTRQVL